jgi:hypothetical protein
MCTCGNSAPHVIARRATSDGVTVEIWHDGAITGRLGRAIPGVPIARPRTPAGLERAKETARLVADAVALYDVSELPELVQRARKSVVRERSSVD